MPGPEQILRQVQALVDVRRTQDDSDGQLLERFLGQHEEAAFAALVQRHGPMVLGVCRRILGNAADADDAFQVTFLTLASKARTLRHRPALSSWLYRVAYLVSLRARLRSVRRRAQESQVMVAAGADPASETARRELESMLDEELHRLPEKYRAPLVLCGLQGKTGDEAARALGWPIGSLSRRLAKGRELLRQRLARHGFAIPASGLAVLLTENAVAAVPERLAETTVGHALLLATGQTVQAGGVGSGVAALLTETLRAMTMKKIKIAGVFLLVLGACAAAAGMGLARLARTAGDSQVVAFVAPAAADTELRKDDRFWLCARFPKKITAFRPDGKAQKDISHVFLCPPDTMSPDRAQFVEHLATKAGSSIWIADCPERDSVKDVLEGKVPVRNRKLLVESGFNAVWAPDGKRVIFQWFRDLDEISQIYAIEKDGTNLTRLTDHKPGAFLGRLSRDGHLAFFGLRGEPGERYCRDLVVTRGTESKTIAEDIPLWDHAWSPDGQIIAYSTTGALVFHNVRTGKARHINFQEIETARDADGKEFDAHGAFSIRWRPDGEAVACIINRVGRAKGLAGSVSLDTRRVFVIPLAGKPTWLDVSDAASAHWIDWVGRP